MPRHWPQLDPDRPSGRRSARDRLSIVTPAGPEELRRRFAAIDDENRDLAAHVRRLEAELCRSSSELARLRGDLRSAVRDSLTDPLTGLANRRSFDLHLEAAVASAGRAAPTHLLMADIDHFKRINDAHGHDIGDEVLRIVGHVILANVRQDSVIARVGGDEFGLLLQGISAHDAAEIANRLCGLLASRPLVGRDFPEAIERITLSIGVAGWREGESSDQWFARADATLYDAKRRGRNRVVGDTRQPSDVIPAGDGTFFTAAWPRRSP